MRESMTVRRAQSDEPPGQIAADEAEAAGDQNGLITEGIRKIGHG
jgi:hypothetical protein